MSINLGFFCCVGYVFTNTTLVREVEVSEWDTDVSKEAPVPTK